MLKLFESVSERKRISIVPSLAEVVSSICLGCLVYSLYTALQIVTKIGTNMRKNYIV